MFGFSGLFLYDIIYRFMSRGVKILILKKQVIPQELSRPSCLFDIHDKVVIHVAKNKQDDGVPLVGEIIYLSDRFVTVDFGRYRESFSIMDINTLGKGIHEN